MGSFTEVITPALRGKKFDNLTAAAEANVRWQSEQLLKRSEILRTAHEKGDLTMLRGIYDVEGHNKANTPWNWTTVWGKLVGITPEYTRGDKIIAWSVVGYAIVYKFGLCFVAVLIWNMISPWPTHWWSTYFFITSLVVTGIVGIISTFWFLIGGVLDTRRLFKDLGARIDNPLDNGQVEGHVSLADKAIFEAKTHEKQD